MKESPVLAAPPIQSPRDQELTTEPDLGFEQTIQAIQKARIAGMVIASRLLSGVVMSAREESILDTAINQSQEIAGAVDLKGNLPSLGLGDAIKNIQDGKVAFRLLLEETKKRVIEEARNRFGQIDLFNIVLEEAIKTAITEFREGSRERLETEALALFEDAKLRVYRQREGEQKQADESRQMSAAIKEFLPVILDRIASLAPTLRIVGIDSDEASQIGQIATWNAIKKFDPTKGLTLKNYIIAEVTRKLLDSIRQRGNWTRTQIENYKRLRDAERSFIATNGFSPNSDQIQAATGLTPEQQDAPRMARVTISLDQLATDEEGNILKGDDVISAFDTDLTPEEALDESEKRRTVLDALNMLSPREKRVIELLFFEGLTQAQTGEIVGLSGSRIRQIKNIAFGKMRQVLTSAI